LEMKQKTKIKILEQPKNANFDYGANEVWVELFKKIFGIK